MENIIKKILVLGVSLIMCLGLFTGCETNKYHAEIFSGNYGFNRKFLKSWLDSESSIEDADEWYDKYSNNELLISKSQALIIKDQNEANLAFDGPTDFDFEKKMLVYCFIVEPTYYIKESPTYKVKNIRIDGLTLRFNIEIKARVSSAEQVFKQRTKLIIMDKLDVITAVFSIVRTS